MSRLGPYSSGNQTHSRMNQKRLQSPSTSFPIRPSANLDNFFWTLETARSVHTALFIKSISSYKYPHNPLNQTVKNKKKSSQQVSVSQITAHIRITSMSLIPSFFGGRRGNNAFDPFALDVWDPFRDFSSVGFPSELSKEATAIVNARVDWKETPEAHLFKADLPGLKKEEVKVEVEDGRVLQISGERSRENEEKNDKWHRIERSSGKFVRRFQLPENAKMDQIKASMENGVLTVTVPKEEVKKPDVKTIDISG